jgi:hypothetical protein
VVALVGADSSPALMSHRVVSVVRPQQHGGEEPADGRRPQHDHGDRDNEPGTIPPKAKRPVHQRESRARPDRTNRTDDRARGCHVCHERVAPVRQGPRRDRLVRRRHRQPPPLPRGRSERAPVPSRVPTGISNPASSSMKHAPRAAPATRPTTKLRSSSLTVGITATGPYSSSERGSCPHPNGRHATPCGPCGEALLQPPACLVSRSRSILLTARRSPKCLVRPTVRIDAMYLPSHLELRPVWCGGVRHRR